MGKGAISARAGGTTAPFLNGTEVTFQTPGGRCVPKALCDPQAGCSVPGGILDVTDVQ